MTERAKKSLNGAGNGEEKSKRRMCLSGCISFINLAHQMAAA